MRRFRVLTNLLTLGAFVHGCSSTEVDPLRSLPPSAPSYAYVPHPVGYDLGDINAIFANELAPSRDQLAGCNDKLNRLRSLTYSKEELAQGARELVRVDPVKYHWCFYQCIVSLEDELKNEAFIDARQKLVIDAYEFLTPIARAFSSEYRDSRYLRWAIRRYKRLSEWVFFRRVDLTPQATSELAEAMSPFEQSPRTSREDPLTVLEKYGLSEKPLEIYPPTAPAPDSSYLVQAAPPEASRDPASEASPEPEATLEPLDLPSPEASPEPSPSATQELAPPTS